MEATCNSTMFLLQFCTFLVSATFTEVPSGISRNQNLLAICCNLLQHFQQ